MIHPERRRENLKKMDREKVIKGLECLLSDAKCDLQNCHYGKFSECINAVLADALELLKDQEAIEPEIEGSSNSWWNVCGECHTAINPNAKYCSQCGKKILWK